jgi:GNAT-family acetyltransferase (TIGR03103 family)
MATHDPGSRHRLEGLSLRNWSKPRGPEAKALARDAIVRCGWGRLLFGHTFRSNEALAAELLRERPGTRDIALYLRDPHVVLSIAPQDLFLDPSHTYRLWFERYRPDLPPQGFFVRRAANRRDAAAMNTLYHARDMVPVDAEFVVASRNSKVLTHLVAEDARSGEIVGTVTGVDHVNAFGDPEHGSSLWCLAVDPQANQPGVGDGLVRHLAEHYQARGRAFMDLSVHHENEQAIGLYEKLGFERVPVFCLKHKNPINERLFMGPVPETHLNPYSKIIVAEARRRGIGVKIIDEEANFFSLTLGGRTIRCRESLTELTSAIAVGICDDKKLCRRLVREAGIAAPEQRVAGTRQQNEAFLAEYGRVVVKPLRGEQGAGVSVDVRDPASLAQAVERARTHCETVLLERYVEGVDLRVLVINHEIVAAAIRRPASVVGTGEHTVEELIRKQSRRRAAATEGESSIPIDDETRRCVAEAGHYFESVLPRNERLIVRRTANLHTGGTLHDVTGELSDALAQAALTAARVIDIPVVGLDFIVSSVDGDEYAFIEANERPGLANHEPQPTAERFVDLLFQETASPHLSA